MLELNGKFNNAKVFTDNVDNETISQIIELCNQESVKDCKIRIMPDCHAGAGCVIGTTMTIRDKVIPNLVGVDIGCGMIFIKLGKIKIDFSELDRFIRSSIPSGMNINNHASKCYMTKMLKDLRCFNQINYDRACKSIGTLGGGNHFIEVDKDDEDNLWIVIHSGSRHLGKEVATFYQKSAYRVITDNRDEKDEIIKRIVDRLKSEGRQGDIESEVSKIKFPNTKIKKDLAFCENQLFDDYIHDMKITQLFASTNREVMANLIIDYLLKSRSGLIYSEVRENHSQTIHNYIDTDNMILRKGSVSARQNETLIIPMNMRDGSLICTGKGNPDWNYSAPHGAGRVLSRSRAKEEVSLNEYKESMKGIYTTSVNMSTIDESPMAYKPMEEIIENIKDTVVIDKIIKPVYNFKAGEEHDR